MNKSSEQKSEARASARKLSPELDEFLHMLKALENQPTEQAQISI